MDRDPRPAEAARRRMLGLGLGAAAAVVCSRWADPAAATPATASTQRASASPSIQPRAAWASGIADAPGLAEEAAGGVRVLLVHHSETSNSYRPDSAASQIRSFHRYHTTTKGWPDVAYNFFVDRYGGIWEGRTGSLTVPVIGDATGGNQGSSQLCCFIGSHTTEAPTAEAQIAMVSLLAWLSTRYQVDPLGRTSFTSRGSNRWPAGATIETATIEGHRAMSQTTCPGDAAYPLVVGLFRQQVAALAGSPASATTTTSPVTTATPSASSAVLPPARDPTEATDHVVVAPTARAEDPRDHPSSGGGDGGQDRTTQLGVGAAALGGGVLVAVAVSRSRRRSDQEPGRARSDNPSSFGDGSGTAADPRHQAPSP